MKKITTMLSAIAVLTLLSCSDTADSNPVSSLTTTTETPDEEIVIEVPSRYGCTIESIKVTSLDASGWDALGTEGDPYFSFYYNGELVGNTNYKKDITKYDLPLTFLLNKTIENPFENSLKIKLMDSDASVDDEKIMWAQIFLDKNKSHISLTSSAYNFSATVNLKWIVVE